jgi:hypothetical protein
MMGMSRKPHGPKLTWDKVRQIRELRASDVSLAQLQARFGISRQWLWDTPNREACQARRDRTYRYGLDLVAVEGVQGGAAARLRSTSVNFRLVPGTI